MKHAFGDSWESNWLELNASNERSIGVIRTKVKEFASRGVIGTYTTPDEEDPPDAVQCRFLGRGGQPHPRRSVGPTPNHGALQTDPLHPLVNYPQKLIDPIKDRCAFSDTRFRPVSNEDMRIALTALSDALSPDAMHLLCKTSRGSMRKGLNLLWTLTRIKGPVHVDDVKDLITTMDPDRTKSLLAKVAKAKKASRSDSLRLFREVDKEVDAMAKRGMTGVRFSTPSMTSWPTTTPCPSACNRQSSRASATASIGPAWLKTMCWPSKRSYGRWSFEHNPYIYGAISQDHVGSPIVPTRTLNR